MITEILAQIRGPNFTAGIVLFDDKVVETAPIVRRMRGWTRDRVRAECRRLGWNISVVHQIQREDVTAPPTLKAGIVQHEESFEAVRADGSVEFFYFDDNASRRAINGRLSREATFAKAQAYLQSRATGDS
jgi:hypothetical protein